MKAQLEAHIEKEKEETSQILTQLETENAELKSRIEDQVRTIKELEDELNQKREQNEQLESRVVEIEGELKEAEGKIEKLTHELSMSSMSKDEIVEDLERTIEDLKRDLEASEDEAYTAMEKTRFIEVQLRLSNQKLRVTEQLLTEKEESFNAAEKKYLEECKHLEERISRLSHIITAHNEAYRGMITKISENMNNSLSGMESVARKMEEEHEKFSSNILNMSQEIQILKRFAVGKKIEREKLEEEMSNLTKLLQEERESGLVMREKISKQNGEKEELIGEIIQLKKAVDIAVKQKDEMLVDLKEEKREAIRQLCLWCDYLLSCNYELKDIVSKFTLKRQQQSTR